ncbi:MAG: prolyl oligopeptidase family serine peptidase, partial [Verrucomicrobiota bacterium]
MFPRFPLARCLGLLLLCRSAFADGPADNLPDQVRPVPPPGIRLADADRSELTEGAAALARDMESLRQAVASKPALQARLPDVEIFHKAVDWALRYDEVFRTNEVGTARQLLKAGATRVEALRAGEVPWNTATGLVVRGYRSRIDDSIQPYGLVIPAGYRPDSGRRWRLDFWFHGRGEQLSELSFLGDRMRNPGEFTPPDTFVLHLYGRYCNGSRFAGETDFWEALADVQALYPIDEDRMVVRGFSLGGAACWHIATHHAGRWAAAAPGAGFSETAEFLNVFQKEKLTPSWWEQKLWRWYDSTEHALNVRMVPLVAYSGADDSQIQAARAMERAMEREQLTLTHLIGPKTGHRYEPATKAELNRRLDTLARRGRTRTPPEVHFLTHTLKYPTMAWVTVDGLDAHWEPARVLARLPAGAAPLAVEVTNVAAFSLRFEPGDAPFPATGPVAVRITDRTPGAGPVTLTGPRPGSDASWAASFHRENGRWVSGPVADGGLRKRPGLQGPIDDAF